MLLNLRCLFCFHSFFTEFDYIRMAYWVIAWLFDSVENISFIFLSIYIKGKVCLSVCYVIPSIKTDRADFHAVFAIGMLIDLARFVAKKYYRQCVSVCLSVCLSDRKKNGVRGSKISWFKWKFSSNEASQICDLCKRSTWM